MKKTSILFIFLIVSLLLPLTFETFICNTQEKVENSFGNPSIPPLYNFTKFWNKFNANSAWDLEYNNGSGWISRKQDLTVIKNYKLKIDFPETYKIIPATKENGSFVKVSLNFTASYNADYRLTFGIDLRVKNYTHKSGSWNYTITYQNHTVYFDWTDIKNIPNLIVSHGVKTIGNDRYFWFRIRRNNVPKGANLYIDPTFGKSDIGGSTAGFSHDNNDYYTLLCKQNVSEAGTMSKTTFYFYSETATSQITGVIYSDNAGVPTNRLAYGSNFTAVPANTWGWYDGEVSYSFSAGTYWIGAIIHNNGGQSHSSWYKYDSGSTNQTSYFDGSSGDYPPPDPFTPGGYHAYNVSLYATYTVGQEENVYGVINQVFTLSSYRTFALTRMGVINQQFSLSSYQTFSLNRYGVINQQFSISSYRTFALTRTGVINQVFTISSYVASGVVQRFLGAIGQQFSVGSYKVVSGRMEGVLQQLWTITGGTVFPEAAPTYATIGFVLVCFILAAFIILPLVALIWKRRQ